ncbi:DHHC-type zinc finger family protein [Actinidia rufa]|uniref:DHHC-type zinc finger family protein n=1 Tax=Actinidia rufa TaxID=165716 RepID=A0A7J0FGP6_9ERIC|nr:DHHC-type zinc finger family protein [Actinidia rufa]
MEAEIVDRLGNGFSRAPFVTVVALCTAVSLLACVPLGELFFFHMILIRKGITTYGYVVAMRAMSEAPAGASVDEEQPTLLYSPSGSATTGFSGGSSLGMQYKGAWCTPPRVFVDYQEEVVPHLEPGMIPSTVDPDAAGNKVTKRPVRISAWKLAKLDSTEAVRAAAKVRASSSVLRLVDNRPMLDPELSSSDNLSVVSSMSTDMGVTKDTKNELRISPLRSSFGLSQGSWDEYESSSKPAVVQDQPRTSKAALPRINHPLPHASVGFDEKIMQRGSTAARDPSLLPAAATNLLREVERTSVGWDQEAGRYVSVPVSASEARSRFAGVSNHTAEIGSSDRRLAILPPETLSSSVMKDPLQQSEKLMYTGESIFFGGPLLSVPVRDGLRDENSASSRQGLDRVVLNLSRESRFKRDTASKQLPPRGSQAESSGWIGFGK